MIHVGEYYEYIGGCSVHQRDLMSTLGGYHEYIRGYHEYIGGFSVHRSFQQKLKGFYPVAPPHVS